MNRVCKTPLCNIEFSTEFKQKKYCSSCIKRRTYALEIFRKIKKNNLKLTSLIEDKADVSTLFSNNASVMRILYDTTGIDLSLSLSRCSDVEAEIVKNYLLRACKYIDKHKKRIEAISDVKEI